MTQHNVGLFRDRLSRPEAGVVFPFTDESLTAILVGLEPTYKDSVLSIGGCGDQAFAILEKAGGVVVCDINEAQLELVRKRKAALEEGDYKTFFLPTSTGQSLSEEEYNRLGYFGINGRIVNIQRKLPNLEIAGQRGIEDFAGERRFTGIYASNAISRPYSKGSLDEQLAQVVSALHGGGLLYVSNGDTLADLVPDVSKLGLQLVQRLTGLARSAEKNPDWKPSVYQKMRPGNYLK